MTNFEPVDALEAADSDFKFSTSVMLKAGELLTEKEKRRIILRYLGETNDQADSTPVQELFYEYEVMALGLSIGVTHETLQLFAPERFDLEAVIRMHLREDTHRGSCEFDAITDVLNRLDASSAFFGIERNRFDEEGDYLLFEKLEHARADY